MTSTFAPTAEQAAIIDRFRALGPQEVLQVEAMAGTGKTTTSVSCARARAQLHPDELGLYLAFNRSVAEEARSRFPRTTVCRTAHGLAYRALRYRGDTPLGRYLPSHLAELLPAPGHGDARTFCRLVLMTLERFIKSIDSEPEAEHLPPHDGKPLPSGLAGKVLDATRKVWTAIDENRIVPTFDALLKRYHVQLTSGILAPPAVAYVLLDEAQDADPVMLDILDAMPNVAQLRVGDPYQQLYRFRGAVNAMASGHPSLPLTGSFRFGAAVADLANALLAHHPAPPRFRLRGLAETATRVHHLPPFPRPDAVLCRGNRLAVDLALELIDRGRRVHCDSNPKEQIVFLSSARALHKGELDKVRHDTLQAFASWADLRRHSEDTGDHELRTVIDLVERNRVGKRIIDLKNLERRSVSRAEADTLVTTIHKAKGLEWPSTRIANDLVTIGELKRGELDRPEATVDDLMDEVNIAYVAATRGQLACATPWPELAARPAYPQPAAAKGPRPRSTGGPAGPSAARSSDGFARARRRA